jgi:hypothetical protein
LRGKQHAFNKQPRVAESALAHSDDSEYVYHLAEKCVHDETRTIFLRSLSINGGETLDRLTIGPMPRAGKAPAKPVTRAQPDSSDDEEGDHEHDVREQEELLIACAANIGRGTSTDPLVLSERQPPPRPATAPGAHDAGLDYGASAAMTRVPKRKQRIVFELHDELHERAPAGCGARAARRCARRG